MTEETYNELMKDYERQLYTAKELAYVSFKDLKHKQRLSEIYTVIFNKKSDMMNGCGRCALRETREIAEEYYKEKAARVVTDKQEVTEIKPNKKATKTSKENGKVSNGRREE